MAQRSVFPLKVTHLWNLRALHSAGVWVLALLFPPCVCVWCVCVCVHFLTSLTLHTKLDVRCICNWRHLRWPELLLAFCKVYIYLYTHTHIGEHHEASIFVL